MAKHVDTKSSIRRSAQASGVDRKVDEMEAMLVREKRQLPPKRK